ncbi:MAG: hypothetical protein ISS69_05670 [Phycisphaerae bacterium]|nr:hypothetical protein [Phycisphaerae bacterium]
MDDHSSPTTLTIPALRSGGVMLTYRCTNKCKHCLYRCSPQQVDTWMSLDLAEQVFAAMAREPQLRDVHIAGGEATLKMDLLADVIALAVRMGVSLSYLETNAMWCTDGDTARESFLRLARAGLPGVLVSASPYHNEFVPFVRTQTCVEAAIDVFGRGGVIVWIPQLYQALAQMPADRTNTLAEFCHAAGLSDEIGAVGRIYGLIPGGRVLDELRDCYPARPAEDFSSCRCDGELYNTSHFHIDPFGNLFTGLCPGIAAGKIGDLHPQITAENHPVFWHLATGGPCALMQWARDHHNYQPQRDAYISKCDLCTDIRRHLHALGGFEEIAPDTFYAN